MGLYLCTRSTRYSPIIEPENQSWLAELAKFDMSWDLVDVRDFGRDNLLLIGPASGIVESQVHSLLGWYARLTSRNEEAELEGLPKLSVNFVKQLIELCVELTQFGGGLNVTPSNLVIWLFNHIGDEFWFDHP